MYRCTGRTDMTKITLNYFLSHIDKTFSKFESHTNSGFVFSDTQRTFAVMGPYFIDHSPEQASLRPTPTPPPPRTHLHSQDLQDVT